MNTPKCVLFLLVLIIAILNGFTLFAQAIIIDHHCIDYTAIPASWINQAKNKLRISYGHTSHGSQLVSGMESLTEDPASGDLYDFTTDGSIHAGALSIADGTPDGDLGNPDFTTWEALTRAYLDNGGSNRNVVMWSWCGQVSWASEADITTYLTLMNGLEQDYPNVKFVYMTGHLDGTGVGGNLNQRNNQIRNYCRTHNKILFDFADIESYNPDGVGFLNQGADDGCNYSGGNWAQQWISTHPGSKLTQLAGLCFYGCAHSENLNCVLKGNAAWWLFALVLTMNAQFCARISQKWQIVRCFLTSGEKEKIILLPVSHTSVNKAKKLGLDLKPLKLRLIRIDHDNQTQVLITSLTDTTRYPHGAFADLYHSRWPVEEDYKAIKCRIELENFSGKSALSVYQDFHAKVLMKNIISLLASPVNDSLTADSLPDCKYNYQVNFTHALATGKDLIPLLFQRSKRKMALIIKALFELLKKTIEPIRLGRKFPRKHRVSSRKFFACYKPIA